MIAESTKSSFCFAFICEPGELEIKSLLLAYSLRKLYNNQTRLFALIPVHKKVNLSPSTINILEKFSIEVSFFENPITQNKQNIFRYEPMSNKFFGISKIEFQGTIIFLDSDIICLKSIPQNILEHKISVKPADYSLNARWDVIYSIADLPLPQNQVRCTFDDCFGPPYFNTGVIVLQSDIKENLCRAWEHFFRLFSEKAIIERNLYNSYHCDQLAFALSTQKLRLDINELTESYNFPVRSRRYLSENAIFAHYHDCITIASNFRLKNIFMEFLSAYPEYSELLKVHTDWRLLSKNKIRSLKFFMYLRSVKNKLKRIYARMK